MTQAGSIARARPAGIRRVFAWTIFPLVMGCAVAFAIGLIERGVHPLLAFAAAQIPAFAIVIAFERIFPYQIGWNRSRGDVRVDAAHLVTITVVGAMIQPGINALGAGLGAWLSAGLGLSLWPIHWPLAAQLALALAIGELFQYWVHRLEHERDFLWRFHATHHSAPRLYWLNASRFHFVDIALNNIAAFVPLVALGAGLEIFVLWNLFAAIHGIFQHANLELRLGPLNWIFSMAELHRWHHSRRVEESNRNYGQNLILWDIVFGTRYLPADRLPPVDIGIAGLSAFPMTWWAQITSPLHWRQITRDSQRAPAGGA